MEAERIYDHKQACANAKLDNQEMGKAFAWPESCAQTPANLHCKTKLP